jgi:hypothetical protein
VQALAQNRVGVEGRRVSISPVEDG